MVKEKIISLLKKKNKEYVSGESLAKKLGISRTAVWKNIKALKKEGYKVAAKPRVGYRLIGKPDLLSTLEIKDGLKTRIFGCKVFCFKELSSTQEVAKKLAAQGCAEGTVVVAEKQTKGRGRIGREWVSPMGGVWLSIVLRPEIPPQHSQRITLVTGVAVAKTIRKLYGLDAKIKWPNDVLVNGYKVCGILVEASGEADRINYMVVGVGVNLNVDFAKVNPSLVGIAASISQILGKKVSRVEFIREFLVEMEKLYILFNRSKFNQILVEWKNLSETLGCKVKVISQKEAFVGKALDVDEDGFLLVRVEDGTVRKIVAGDVSIRRE